VRLDHLLSKELQEFLVEATDRTCPRGHDLAHCSALKERKAAYGPPFLMSSRLTAISGTNQPLSEQMDPNIGSMGFFGQKLIVFDQFSANEAK
jgi:hypothetical protein